MAMLAQSQELHGENSEEVACGLFLAGLISVALRRKPRKLMQILGSGSKLPEIISGDVPLLRKMTEALDDLPWRYQRQDDPRSTQC